MESVVATLEQSNLKQKLIHSLWILLLISIPFTSSPLVAFFTGGGPVSPLAGIPLILLLGLWYVPHFLRSRTIPKVAVPLLLFVGIALLSTVMSVFLEHLPFLGQASLGRGIRALITLFLGIGFYFVIANYPSTPRKMTRSIQWLYVGGIFMLLWSTIQILFVFRDASIPKDIWLLHRVFSNRDMLYTRVTGMAYEPSWLANLLVILYIPLWLSSVIRGFTVFQNRFRKITIELVLLLWGIVVLFLSFSRVGLLSFFTIVGTLGLVGSWRLAGKLAKGKDSETQGRQKIYIRKGLHLALWIFFILFVILLIYYVVLLASRLDSRIERMFETDFISVIEESPTPVFTIANRLAYAERVMFWTIGLRVFANHPILGVGLGNTGFYFQELAPAYSYYLPELVRILTGTQAFPNPKNLWVRLLAETGIIGFSTFMIWFFIMALGALRLLKRNNGLAGVIGLATLLAILAQFWEGFSLDTFALPQFWVLMGFTTLLLRNESNPNESADEPSKVLEAIR